MRPGEQQYLYAQQQQQQQRAFLNSGFSQLHQQQQQQHGSNPAAFLSPHYAAQLAALNGLQVVGNGMQMGGGAAAAMPGMMHRGVLSMQQNGLLPQQQQWAQLRPESQAWVSGVFPSSQQGLLQPNLVQQHVQQQQQVAYLQELRSGSVGLNGGLLPQQIHPGGDSGLLRTQQWGHPHDGGHGQYGASPTAQDSRRLQEGMRPAEFSRGSGNGGSYGHPRGNGNSHNKPFNKNDRMFGNRSRGGGGGGSGGGGGPAANPRFRDGKQEKGPGENLVRSQQAGGSSLRCDACDRTFKNSQQFTAHNNTHIKCDVEGCSFQASGRVVKEHKQAAHDSSASEAQVRANSLKSKESDEEISRWIEERKRNYPTAKNIQRKAEDMKAKKLRGELVDEDAKKRRERLKEILAKQAELGVPVAEVPSYYMSDRYGSLRGKGAIGESSGPGPSDDRRKGKRGHDRVHLVPHGDAKDGDKEPPAKVPRILDGSKDSVELAVRACHDGQGFVREVNGVRAEIKKPIKETQKIPKVKEEEREEPQDVFPKEENGPKASGKSSEKVCYFYKRGRCKKGNRCEFSHERRSKKQKEDAKARPAPKRAPTLLAKLLEADIRREKSHLLQSLRFFVNNMFLLEYPEKPLKFFEWQESSGADRNSDAEVGRPDTEALDALHGGETGSDDDDAETSQEEEDSGEVTRLDGEAEETEFEGLLGSDGDTPDDAEDGAGSDEEMETLHEEENRSEVVTRSDEEEMDF